MISYKKTITLKSENNKKKKMTEQDMTIHSVGQNTNDEMFSKNTKPKIYKKCKKIENQSTKEVQKVKENEITNQKENIKENDLIIQKSNTLIENYIYKKFEETIIEKIKSRKKSSKKITYKIIKKSCLFSINYLLCCRCCKKRKNTYEMFLENAMEKFTEKMDIFNIYKILSLYGEVDYEQEEI